MGFVRDTLSPGGMLPKPKAPVEPASSRVQKHALQIGARVTFWTLNKLKKAVQEESMLCFERQQFDCALDGFAHCLAIEESLRWRDTSFTAAAEYNIGACLHCLREFDESSVSFLVAAALIPYPRAVPAARASTTNGMQLHLRTTSIPAQPAFLPPLFRPSRLSPTQRLSCPKSQIADMVRTVVRDAAQE